MSKVGAIITGGDFQALAAMRTLSKKGIEVFLLDNDLCIGRYSRYKSKFFRAPPMSDAKAYLAFLINLADKMNAKGWVIIPNNDEAVYFLSKNKELLASYYKIPTPPWEIIKNIHIKKNTYQLAERHGIPVPKTFYPANSYELDHLDLSFPMVVKPSIRDNFYNKVKKKAIRVDNGQQLHKVYDWACTIIPPSEVMIQEFIPGGASHLYSYCLFIKNGEVISGISANRSRQHPMDFGHATTYAEVVDIPILKEMATTFLSLINYYGIAEVEFMKDPNGGKYKLIEVNPRIWGWHSLAIAAGIDLPYFLYQDLTGETIKPPPRAKDMKWVRLITDIPTSWGEILKGNLRVSDYYASLKGKKEFAVFNIRDPFPFLAEIAMLPYLIKKRGF